jgi:hypothetical protein
MDKYKLVPLHVMFLLLVSTICSCCERQTVAFSLTLAETLFAGVGVKVNA